jgi:hypothetical protein
MPKPDAKPAKQQPKPDALATLKKLQAKDPGLKKLLEKAYAYAVFPAVGKANLVIGGALGRGEVFEKGKKVGFATITQLTIGVQIGGDTFDEVVVFESRESFERFKRGKTAFAANASAVLVKAGAASAKDFEKGAAVYVYPHGGMMLELAIGGQRFKFKPADEEQGGQKGGQQSGKASGKGKGAQGRGQEDEGEEEGQDEGEEAGEGEEGAEEASSSSGGGNRALELAGRAVGGVRNAAAKATEMVKRHPVAAPVAGVGAVAGLGLLIARAMSGGAEEGEDDQDSGGEEDEQDEGAQDSAEDSDEDQSDEDEDQSDEDEDEDRDEEDEDTDARAEDEGGEDEDSEEDESENRGVLSRLLSRGKSRA